jgi:hypothetical protein
VTLDIDKLCREYLRAIAMDRQADAPASPLLAIAEAVAGGLVPKPGVGQIWSVDPPDGEDGIGALVALTEVSPTIAAVLVSDQTWLASNDDIIVTADDSPWDEEFLLCTWKKYRVARRSLVGHLGDLRESTIQVLEMLTRHRDRGGFRLRAHESSRTDEGLDRLRWTIAKGADDAAARSFLAGPRILDDDDLRGQVRASLADATRWVEQVALEARVAEGSPLTVDLVRVFLQKTLEPFVPGDSTSATQHAAGARRGVRGAGVLAGLAATGALAHGIAPRFLPPQIQLAALAASLAVSVVRRLRKKSSPPLLETEFSVGPAHVAISWKFADEYLILDIEAVDSAGAPIEGVEISLDLDGEADSGASRNSVLTDDRGVVFLVQPLEDWHPSRDRHLTLSIACGDDRFDRRLRVP